jgi:hypothetical protein
MECDNEILVIDSFAPVSEPERERFGRWLITRCPIALLNDHRSRNIGHGGRFGKLSQRRIRPPKGNLCWIKSPVDRRLWIAYFKR